MIDPGIVVETGFGIGLIVLWVELYMWILAKLGLPFASYVDEVGGE